MVIFLMGGGHPSVTQQGSSSELLLFIVPAKALNIILLCIMVNYGLAHHPAGCKLLEGQGFALSNHFLILHNT